MSIYSLKGKYENYTPPPPVKKKIGSYIKNTDQLQRRLDDHYTKYMDNKLILYNKIIYQLINRRSVNNEQLLILIRAVETKRSYKNNTLSNLINLYNMIYQIYILFPDL